MRINHKKGIVRVINGLLLLFVLAISIILISQLLILVFDLEVFKFETSMILYSSVGLLFVLVLSLAIISIALNIDILASVKIEESEIITGRTGKYWWIYGLLSLLLLGGITGSFFYADYASKQQKENRLKSQARILTERFSDSIEKMPIWVSTKNDSIVEALDLLSNQHEDYPSISVITRDTTKQVFLKINSQMDTIQFQMSYFGDSFYKCNESDCNYLKNVFDEKEMDTKFWMDKSHYKYYYPVKNEEEIIILFFSDYDGYGKVGR